jgi:hypothetical protein
MQQLLENLAEPRVARRAPTRFPPFSIQLIDLPPGQNHTEYFLLNKIYDVSSPGVYLVQVQQQPVAGRPTAQSNTIKIVVQ